MGDIKTKALRAHSDGRLLEAEHLYRALLNRNDDPDIAINLGALLRSQGRLQEGSSHYHRCLDRWPDSRELILNAWNCWKSTGENSVGLHWLQAVLKQHPYDRQLTEALAEALALAGMTAEAVRHYELILKKDPTRLQSWMGLGLVHARAGQLQASKASYQKVLSIDPNEPRAKANLLTIYKQTGEFQAADALIDALDLVQRQDPDIRKAIGDLKLAGGDNVAASHHLASLAASHPIRAEHWLNWAASLKGMKYTVAPTQILKRGLLFHPNDRNLWLALEQAFFEMCNFDSAQKICTKQKLDNDLNNNEQLFNRQFLSLSHPQTDELCRKRRKWSADWEIGQKKNTNGPIWPDLLLEPSNGRRLRIGYLSADFCNHPVGRFMLPILEHHDKARLKYGASVADHTKTGLAN